VADHTAESPLWPAPRRKRALLRYQTARETRERLALAGSKLFGQHGFDEVTIDQICEHAGVSRSSYYFHFPDKEAILGELDAVAARRVSEDLAKHSVQGEGTIESDLDVFVDGLVRRARRIPRELLARTMTSGMRRLHDVGQLPDEDSDFGRALADCFRRAQERGEVPRAEDPAELGAVLAAMSMEGLLRWAYGTAAERDLRKVLTWRASVFLAGVRTHR
jgi:AcrR family transcriptional regulator